MSGSSPGANQRNSATSSAATGSPSARTSQVTEKTPPVAVRLDVDAQETHGLDLQARLLEELAAKAVGSGLLDSCRKPPGRSQQPRRGSTPRRASSTRPSRSRTPCTPGIAFAQ